MTCEELRPDYTSYALGVADDPERAEIVEHLGRKCPNCVPGVASAMATVTAMSGAVPVKEPPKRLRRRVTAMVAKAPQRPWAATLLPWAITAAASIALLVIGLSGKRESGDTLRQALSILNDPAAKDVAFGEAAFGEKASAPKGRVFVSAGNGVVFMAASLPRIEADKTFELWVIPVRGNPAPEGVFRSQPDSSAVFIRPGPVEPSLMEKGAAVAVTVEPEGGSPQPTTTPFIVTKL